MEKFYTPQCVLPWLSLLFLVLVFSPAAWAQGEMPGEVVEGISEDNQEPVAQRRFTTGLGIGLLYGGVGANLDYLLADHLAPMLNVGVIQKGQMGYGIGARYYPLNSDRQWRPRVMVFYGTASGISDINETFEDQFFNGAAFGAGFLWTSKQQTGGIELDISYTFYNEGLDERLDELREMGWHLKDSVTDFRLSLGFRVLWF